MRRRHKRSLSGTPTRSIVASLEGRCASEHVGLTVNLSFSSGTSTIFARSVKQTTLLVSARAIVLEQHPIKTQVMTVARKRRE